MSENLTATARRDSSEHLSTTTLHCHLHEYGALHGREHSIGTNQHEQTDIIKHDYEYNICGREHDIGQANIEQHRWDLGKAEKGADPEREVVSEEFAPVRGRGR